MPYLCKVNGCEDPGPFANIGQYQKHGRDVHNIRRKYKRRKKAEPVDETPAEEEAVDAEAALYIAATQVFLDAEDSTSVRAIERVLRSLHERFVEDRLRQETAAADAALRLDTRPPAEGASE